MPSTVLFVVATLLLSLNSIRIYGLPVSDWLYLIAVLSAIFETLMLKKDFLRVWISQKVFLLSAVLIILGTLFSLMNTKNIPVATIEVLQTLYVITIFISLTRVMVARGRSEMIVTAFMISGVFAASIAVIDFYTGANFGQFLSNTPNLYFIDRYAGPLSYPNKFGYYLMLTTVLAFYKLISAIRLRRGAAVILVLLIIVLVQAMGVYLSGSIAAYLGLLTGFLCLFYITIPSKIRQAIHVAIFFSIIAILVIGIIGIQYIIKPQMQFPETSLIGIGINRVINITAGSRLDLYAKAMEYNLQSPIIGAGFDQNAASTLQEIERSFAGSIHNPFIQMWYMGGLFAFLGWVILHLYLAKIAVIDLYNRMNKPVLLRSALAAVIIGALAMDFFTNAIYQREKWLVVGLLVNNIWTFREMDK